jgi:hypothetical protein
MAPLKTYSRVETYECRDPDAEPSVKGEMQLIGHASACRTMHGRNESMAAL